MGIMDIILNLQRYSTEVLAYKLDAEFAAAVDAAANLLEAQGERIAEYECTGYSPTDFDRLCREMSDLRMAAGIDTYENLRESLWSGYLKVVKAGDLDYTKLMLDKAVADIQKIAADGKVWMCPFCSHAKSCSDFFADCDLGFGVCQKPFSHFEYRGVNSFEALADLAVEGQSDDEST